MLIIIITSLVGNPCFIFKKWFDIGAKYEKLLDKMQSLERSTNQTKKNIHTQTEELRAGLTAPLHFRTKEEWSTAIRKSTIIYPVIIRNDHQMRGTPKAMGSCRNVNSEEI